MKVSVSILSSYDRLMYAVNNVNESKADFLHVDVMDGKFVDNEKFPLEVVKDISLISKKKLDVHLMVNNILTVKKYAELKPEYLTLHVEIIKNKEIITYLKDMGIKVGLAINPETNIDELLPYINDIDLILFMSVTPGEGGQSFKEEVLDKIIEIKKIINDKVIISIDGGVNDKTIEKCKKAGCDMVVSGSFITNSDNYDEKISLLR